MTSTCKPNRDSAPEPSRDELMRFLLGRADSAEQGRILDAIRERAAARCPDCAPQPVLVEDEAAQIFGEPARAECMGTAPHGPHEFNGGMWCPGLAECGSDSPHEGHGDCRGLEDPYGEDGER